MSTSKSPGDQIRSLVILGPPGAGKTTQSGLLGQDLDAIPVSIGELLRERQRSSSDGVSIAEDIDRGRFISDETAIAVLKAHLSHLSGKIILDGFPRTVPQVQRMPTIDVRLGAPRLVVLHLSVNELLERLSRRAQAENRADDTADAIQLRLDLYKQNIRPVLAACQASNFQIHTISGAGLPSDVARRIVKAVVRP